MLCDLRLAYIRLDNIETCHGQLVRLRQQRRHPCPHWPSTSDGFHYQAPICGHVAWLADISGCPSSTPHSSERLKQVGHLPSHVEAPTRPSSLQMDRPSPTSVPSRHMDACDCSWAWCGRYATTTMIIHCDNALRKYSLPAAITSPLNCYQAISEAWICTRIILMHIQEVQSRHSLDSLFGLVQGILYYILTITFMDVISVSSRNVSYTSLAILLHCVSKREHHICGNNSVKS